MPFGKSLVWTEWDGRDWAPAASVTCRPSFHGYGQDGGDGWQVCNLPAHFLLLSPSF